ncbi:MAG: phosphoesterase [SAR324 cluster bacterium]|nr:phosphoesterase [SAR324 cluster bacterium]
MVLSWGNHDYYKGSLMQVRAQVEDLVLDAPFLRYLSVSEVISLSPEIALIGHDGWADGRYGDYARSRVMLNDYVQIMELKGLDSTERLEMLNILGDQAAAFLQTQLDQALVSHKQILLLTHVPPFKEACWHEDQLSSPEYLPHFSCKAVGDVLLEAMRKYPERQLTVLCGHTHSRGICQKLPNLWVLTGDAVYGKLLIQPPIVLG